jgi:hypothetical protein
METRGSIRLHYGADPQLRAADSGFRSTGRGATYRRERAGHRPRTTGTVGNAG